MQRTAPTIRSTYVAAYTLALFCCGPIQADEAWHEYGSSRQWSTTSASSARSGNRTRSPSVSIAPQVEWSVPIGEGRAQIVGNKQRVFVTSAKVIKSGEKKTLQNLIQCLDARTGNELWQVGFESKVHAGEQETFGNQSACPQATPLLIDNRLIAIDFAGVMICVDTERGKTLWKTDLVGELNAVPVQFGFASSPIRVPGTSDFVVLAAGDGGGLHRIDSNTGRIRWTSECNSFSYATPILAKLQDVEQWILVSEQQVRGVSAEGGQELWSYPLPKPGLTNVPTPLPLTGNRLLLSGQGCGGTRCIQIETTNSKSTLQAVEVWSQPKVQLFYTNWITLGEKYALGCTDGFLALLHLEDGSIAGRWRGFADGNLIQHGERLVLVGGKGTMSMFAPPAENTDMLLETARFQLAKGRYWTPPSVMENQWFLRTSSELTCYRMTPTDSRNRLDLVNLLKEPKKLTIRLQERESEDPVELIFAAFEQKGQQAALELYSKLRAAKKLDAEQRLALAEAAAGQQMIGLQKMILQHAAQDLPDNTQIAKALAEL
ncbi:MAG: PQQ-binding-like beta-propeller repeat protein [Planctomycetota bacterium]